MCSKMGKKGQVVAFLLGLILSRGTATAQKAPTASLAEQLRAQYKVATMGQQDNAPKVLEPGTVLVIQKGGIPAVPYANTTACSAKYLDGKVDSSEAICPEAARKDSHPFKAGEKVYPVQIDVDLKKERISFRIVTCDSCNGTNLTTSSKSEVIFQFAPGYLEKASVLEVEDTIGDLLAVDSSSALQASQATQPQPEDPDPNLLTNDKIIRMASFKLGDAVILSKIKTSQCNFDTSTDGLIKLKRAGVSDAVLQAMVEAAAAPPSEAAGATPATDVPASAPTQTTFSVQHRHINLSDTNSNAVSYCSGDLSVSKDGSVRYDCTQTSDPTGRCDHVSIPAGSLKQAKIGYNGALHLASKGQGNFDFFGDPGTLKQALTAIELPAQITPLASAAPSPTSATSDCDNYDSCMQRGAESLKVSNSNDALADFQKASQLDPTKSDPWKGMAVAYLQMGQQDNGVRMCDKALQSGATLSIPVCHAGFACNDTGNFLLNVKEISFVNKKGEKEFAAAPSALTSRGAISFHDAAYYWEVQLGGKNYRFYYMPIGIQCRSNVLCSGPGITQQKVVADYVHQTLDKLAAGTFPSQPINP